MGGGTGHILEQIAHKHTSGLRITYVDSSKEMLRRAMKKNNGWNSVVFIEQSILDVAFRQEFDVIITPFFFDNFSATTAESIFQKLRAALNKNGLWLHADFHVSKNVLWQKLLLKIMYRFFHLLCNIEARHLTEMEPIFRQAGYRVVSSKTFFRKFTHATIFMKTT